MILLFYSIYQGIISRSKAQIDRHWISSIIAVQHMDMRKGNKNIKEDIWEKSRGIKMEQENKICKKCGKYASYNGKVCMVCMKEINTKKFYGKATEEEKQLV